MSNPHSQTPADPLPVNPDWEVHPAEVQQWRAAGEDVILLDVRNPNEWNFARVDEAVFVPLPQLEQQFRTALADGMQKRIVVYCHLGMRSLRAAAFLRHHGFTDVRSMAGGIDAWSRLIDPAVPRY